MITTVHVEIVTTLEYLGNYGDGDPFWGAIISVGIAGDSGAIGDEDLTKDVLRPWLWKNLSFSLFGLSKNGLQLNNPVGGAMWKRPVRDTAGLVDLKEHKTGALDKAFIRALAAGGPFPGETLRSRISDKPQQSALDPVTQHLPWPAALAQISQMPYPIPHVLNISSFFQAQKPGAGEFVVAIPTVSVHGQTFTPSGSAELLGDVAVQAVYTASAGTNVAVSSVSNRLNYPLVEPKARAGKPTRMDESDPYVPVEQKDVFDSDWLTELPVRLCEPFDLAQRLIDAVSALLRDPKSPVTAEVLRQQIPELRDCLVLGLYDLANTGVDLGPDHGSALKSALARLDKVDISLLEAWGQSLASYQSTIAGEPAKIRELLRATIKEVAGCPALAENQLTPTPPLRSGQSASKSESEAAIKTVLATEVQQWEALQTAVSRDSNLAALLIAQWKRAPLNPKISEAQRDAFVQSAQVQLQDIPLRRRFALGNLARGGQTSYWSNVTKISNTSTDERGDISTNFQTTLDGVMQTRLSGCKVEATVSKALLNKVDDWAKAYATQSLVPSHEASPAVGAKLAALSSESTKPSVPHGISIQADCLYTFSGDKEEQTDVARKSSGFAVFMADDKQPKAWRCLSLARVQFPGGSGKQALPPWQEPVVVPFPIQDEAGLRRCVITYNNGPISAINPASRLGPDARTGEISSPIVSYLNAYSGKDEWAKLPPLVNGRSYKFLVSRISNSGALPKELAKVHSPGELREQGSFDPKFLSPAYLPQARYLRRVPVGGLRVGAPPKLGGDNSPLVTKANQKLVWGENVAGVQPRAVEQVAQTGDLIFRSNAKQPDSVPVMLISDKPHSFSVDRPATDIQTWDRYMAGPTDRTKLRKEVWAKIHRGASRQGEDAGADTLLLEDPAVSAYVLAELVTETNASGAALKALKMASWALKPSPLTVADLRTPPIGVTVKPAAPGAKMAAFSPGEHLEITVPPGVVAYLYLSAVVRRAEVDKFYPGVVGGQVLGGLQIDGMPAGEDLANLYVLPPFAVAFERVIETLPDVESLRSQLAASFTDSRLNVTLTRDSSDAFRNVGRVDILRQRWHWNGRPFGTKEFKFPAGTFSADGTENSAASEQDSKERHKWLLQAFASRKDYEVLSTRLAKLPNGGGSRFERSDDISSEPQATVYRFAVRVWSRYAPLLTGVQSSDSAGARPEDITAWKTVYVPCQSRFAPPSTDKNGDHPGLTKPGQVPVPHIKLILPLTESGEEDSDARGVSGLMVVLEGPWFTVGGVTETLECEIATTTVPGSAPPVQEAGYDAIRSRTIARDNYELRRLIGPIGHTFDESEALPRFVNTSFILPGPKVKTKDRKSDTTDLSLFFGKIRFTRSIQLGGGQGPISSDPTDPYWVQFLPRFVFQANSQEISEASRVILSADGRNLSLRNGDKDLTIQRSADERETTRLFGILTSAISDVTGRRVQEHYVGFFRYTDSTWVSDMPVTTPRSNLRFRIIEVEIPTNHGADPTSLPEFWTRIFPSSRSEKPDDLQDSKARIFRVSRPIGSGSPEGATQ